MDKLLGCPFCGGEAERVDIEDGENAGGSCVTCTQCYACSNVEFEFKENFVSNWNRRAHPVAALSLMGGASASDKATSVSPVIDKTHPVAAPAQEGAWRMVPVEPTREMWAAMGDVLVGYKQRHHDAVAEAFWKASLSAAPSPVIDAAMVERMARTLFERGRSDGNKNDPDAASWEEAPADMREWITGHAKAALAAALGMGT